MSKGIYIRVLAVAALIAAAALVFQFASSPEDTRVAYDTGNSAKLRADQTGGTDAAKASGDVAFRLIVLPDTQKYTKVYPEMFSAQTKWIKEHVKDLNIVFVTQMGDLVEDSGSKGQWDVGNASMSALEGVVPYGIAPGNHDKPLKNMFETYFPAYRFEGYSWYGGSYGNNDDSYQLFSGGGRDYMIMHLEFCPKNDVLDWADKVLKNNSQRNAIIVTHGFLNQNAERNVHVCGDTNYIWDRLIAPNSNVFMVLSGHVHAEAHRVDEVNGRKVAQILADYQDVGKGGNGWLRIMEFMPAEEKIHVRTYSPYLDRYEDTEKGDFTIDL